MTLGVRNLRESSIGRLELDSLGGDGTVVACLLCETSSLFSLYFYRFLEQFLTKLGLSLLRELLDLAR